MSSPSLSRSRWQALLKEYPDAIAAGVCAVLVLIGWFTLDRGWLGFSLLILAAAYVIGGYQNTLEGLGTLWREKELDVDLLMIVAALGAAALGLWRKEYYFIVDGGMLILIFAISGVLEGYAMSRTERSIQGLMSLTSDTARKLVDGQERMVSVAELQLGDRVLVKPGELVPTDGTIVEGSSELNQAPITGESMPVEKTVGDEVFAGTINGNGALKIQIDRSPESSLIQRVIRLVEQAQTETPPSQQFIERFERGYAKAIVLLGILLGTLPPFLLGWTWEDTVYRALIFLVVASPCALMAATMPALLSGIANGARHGILFKNGAQLEAIGQVRAIAFDKTGTLTTGKPQVVQVMAIEHPDKLLQVAAALENMSEHPIGAAIVHAAQKQGREWIEAVNVRSEPGRGISGKVEGKIAVVGKAAFVQAQAANCPESLAKQSQKWEQEGKTVVWVAYDNNILGIIAVADTVRATAARSIRHLKRLGIDRIVMLTGDNQRTAENIAQEIGIDGVYAELLPEAKLEVIRQLQQQYQSVAMVGDGINDAPALAQASVGIAMGIVGSDVALETADVVLMADRLEKLEYAIRLSRRSGQIVKQNIVFALSFILILLVANFTGNMTLPLGVLGHEGSTVLVILNGLRLLKD
ncbi:heavy metal translocating P-type ATPase [Chamaesiphon minutus]|uniref:Copper/silver-translocating P-type ATPase n=1 Tax=Chamaesiphon minutus (strain ATCC 27169 / PCC 6605) TaxID=1173020 RepID=K9UAU5_CHAP6|nr:heavy metal translocating P-type ATPase [Chamaesiphon minutus]AFY92232.1 copper/silver-translocating P-type ATPase [Chamaesiphon minutus PCC 6605]